MDQIAQMSFVDLEEQHEGIAVVRAEPRVVALALSLQSNGDIEVFIAPEVAREIAHSLVVAAERAEA